MAIIENISTESGDVLLIKAKVPIVGLIALTGFMDSTQGEGSDTFFYKEFRYSTDGVNYSNWLELAIENIQSVQIESTDTFFIEYRYTFTGEENNPLIFHNINVDGVYVDPGEYSYFDRSIFKQYFNVSDLNVLNWAINVLEKVYKGNLLPQYIERDSGTFNDKDFLDFWYSVTLFFSFFVNYIRVFENFQLNPTLLEKFVVERGLFLCNDIDYTDLVYLSNHFYDEIRQRGTIQIIKRKNQNTFTDYIDDSISSSFSLSIGAFQESTFNKDVDGELLRLICYEVSKDEFLFNFRERHLVGWNIGNSSPEFKDLYNHINVNKGYEETEDFQYLSKYPLVNTDFIDLIIDDDKQVLRINNPNSASGIGGVANIDKAIIIDPNLDYQITFFVKQTAIQDNISFGIIALDKDNQIINLVDIEGNNTNFFFEDESLNQSDKYYFVRGIVFHKTKELYPFGSQESVLNIGFGKYLKFQEDVIKIIPIITYSHNNSALYIWDFKIWPLATGYGVGFIQPYNFIDIFLKNNNGIYNQTQLDKIIRKYLLPYNTTFKTTLIKDIKAEEYVAPLVIQTVSIINVSTYNGSNGSIDIEIQGGEAPYSYIWSTGATTQDIAGLEAGVYSVSVQDNDGRVASKTFQISEPTPQELSVSYEITNVSIYGDSDGSIVLSIVSGNLPLSYEWSNGATTKDLMNIGAGIYSVVIRDNANNELELNNLEVTQPNFTGIFATGNGRFYRSLDMGNNWDQINIRLSSFEDVILPKTGNNIFLVNYDLLYRSSDDGDTWIELNLNADGIGLVFVNNLIGFRVDTGGQIRKTIDAGDNWELVTVDTAGIPFRAVDFDNPAPSHNVGIACGSQGRVCRSDDGGETWSLISAPNPDFPLQGGIFNSILFLPNTNICFIVGNNLLETPNGAVLLRSNDKGQTWSDLSSQINDTSINCIDVSKNNNNHVVVGGNSKIYRSSNQGASWHEISTPIGVGNILKIIFGNSYDTLLIVNNSGQIYLTTNAGIEWDDITPVSVDIDGIEIKN